jgi:hypothetical protein
MSFPGMIGCTLVGLLLVGCALSGTQPKASGELRMISTESVGRINAGETTYAELINMLGPPLSESDNGPSGIDLPTQTVWERCVHRGQWSQAE